MSGLTGESVEGPGRVTEPCVCGGVIRAEQATWDAVADAVALHNAGPLHTAWRIGLRLVRDERTWGKDGLGVATMMKAVG